MLKRHHIIYLCSLLMEMSLAGVTFSFSRRAAELGQSANVLGLLGAIWIGTYSLAVLANNSITKRFGRGRIARIGCVLCVLSAVGCSFTTDVITLLLWSVVLGIGLAGFWPSAIAWLGEGSSNNTILNRRLASFSISWNIGFLVGYGGAGQLFEHLPRATFLVPAAVFALIGILVSVLERLPSADPIPPGQPALPVEVRPAVPKGRGFRKNAWLANFALSFAFSGVGSLFPQLATSLHISPAVHGSMLALSRGASLITFIALQFLMFWRTRVWPLWVAQILGVFALTAFVWSDSVWLFFAAFIIVGIIAGYCYQASIFFSLEESTEQGQGGSFHEAVLGVGMFTGSLFSGWIGANYSIRAPYIFGASVLAFMVAVQMITVYIRRHQRPV